MCASTTRVPQHTQSIIITFYSSSIEYERLANTEKKRITQQIDALGGEKGLVHLARAVDNAEKANTPVHAFVFFLCWCMCLCFLFVSLCLSVLVCYLWCECECLCLFCVGVVLSMCLSVLVCVCSIHVCVGVIGLVCSIHVCSICVGVSLCVCVSVKDPLLLCSLFSSSTFCVGVCVCLSQIIMYIQQIPQSVLDSVPVPSVSAVPRLSVDVWNEGSGGLLCVFRFFLFSSHIHCVSSFLFALHTHAVTYVVCVFRLFTLSVCVCVNVVCTWPVCVRVCCVVPLCVSECLYLCVCVCVQACVFVLV